MVKDTAAAAGAHGHAHGHEAKAEEKGAKPAEGAAKEKKKPAKKSNDSLEDKAKKPEWTMARLSKVARRFDSEDAWKHGAPSSYKAAHSKGIVAQCMSHVAGHAKKGVAGRGARHSA